MAIPVNMIYDDDTTRKSATAYICMYCMYVFIIIFTIQFCGVRHGPLSTEKRFHRSAFIIYNIRKPF